MKKYEKPELIEETIELEDIIAESQFSIEADGQFSDSRNRSAW